MAEKLRKTKSFYFLLPMLGKVGSTISDFPNVLNCYLKDVDKDYIDALFVLFEWSSSVEYSKFEDGLEQHPHYLERYEPTKFHTMFVFEIPEWRNYNLFLRGKYSTMDEIYKQHILNFLSPEIKTERIENILYKKEVRRKELEKKLEVKINSSLDLLDPPDIEEETFNVKDILNENIV